MNTSEIQQKKLLVQSFLHDIQSKNVDTVLAFLDQLTTWNQTILNQLFPEYLAQIFSTLCEQHPKEIRFSALNTSYTFIPICINDNLKKKFCDTFAPQVSKLYFENVKIFDMEIQTHNSQKIQLNQISTSIFKEAFKEMIACSNYLRDYILAFVNPNTHNQLTPLYSLFTEYFSVITSVISHVWKDIYLGLENSSATILKQEFEELISNTISAFSQLCSILITVNDNDTKITTILCQNLIQFCETMPDMNILSQSWKVLLKVINGEGLIWPNDIDKSRILSLIVTQIEQVFQNFVNEAKRLLSQYEQLLQVDPLETCSKKFNKLIYYYVGHLICLCQKNSAIVKPFCAKLIEIFIRITTHTPSLMAAELVPAQITEYKDKTSKLIDRVLILIMSHPDYDDDFKWSLFQKLRIAPTSQLQVDSQAIEKLMLLVHVLLCFQNVSPTLAANILGNNGCFYWILDGLQQNYHLMFPEHPIKTEPKKYSLPTQHSKYQIIISSIAVFLQRIPATCFPLLENFLFMNIAHPHFFCLFFVLDIWVVVIRNSSDQLQKRHVELLLSIILNPDLASITFTDITSECNYVIKSILRLLSRIVPFLSINVLEFLFNRISDYLNQYKTTLILGMLIQTQPLHLYPKPNLPFITKHFLTVLLTACETAITTSSMSQLFSSLEALRGIFGNKMLEPMIHTSFKQRMINIIIQCINSKHIQNSHRILCQLIDISASLCFEITPPQLIKLLHEYYNFYLEIPETKLVIADFVGVCGNKQINDTQYYNQIFEKLVVFFNQLLSDSNWQVKMQGMNSFNLFAKFTLEFDKILERCIPVPEKDIVVAYLRRIVKHDEVVSNLESQTFEEQQLQQLTWNRKKQMEDYIKQQHVTTSMDQMSLSPHENEVKIVGLLKNAIQEITSIVPTSNGNTYSLTNYFWEELTKARATLDSILLSHNKKHSSL